jgi:uncharacterized protein (DUF1778 family)
MQPSSKLKIVANMALTDEEAQLVSAARNKLRQSLAGFAAKASIEYAQKVLGIDESQVKL